MFSLRSLPETTVVELAKDEKGSFVLQAVFRSPTVSQRDKEFIAKPLKVRVVCALKLRILVRIV